MEVARQRNEGSIQQDRRRRDVGGAWARHGMAWHGMLYNEYDGGGGGPYLHDDGQSIPPYAMAQIQGSSLRGLWRRAGWGAFTALLSLRCAALRKRRAVAGEQ